MTARPTHAEWGLWWQTRIVAIATNATIPPVGHVSDVTARPTHAEWGLWWQTRIVTIATNATIPPVGYCWRTSDVRHRTNGTSFSHPMAHTEVVMETIRVCQGEPLPYGLSYENSLFMTLYQVYYFHPTLCAKRMDICWETIKTV